MCCGGGKLRGENERLHPLVSHVVMRLTHAQGPLRGALPWTSSLYVPTSRLHPRTPFPQAKGAKIVSVASISGCKMEAVCDLSINLPLKRELCPFDLAPVTSTVIQMLFGDTVAIALMQVGEEAWTQGGAPVQGARPRAGGARGSPPNDPDPSLTRTLGAPAPPRRPSTSRGTSTR